MKTGLQLDTKDWDRYIKRLEKKVDKDLDMLVKQTTQDLSRKAKSFVPVNTGRLKTSIRSRYRRKDGEVKVGVDYGAYVEFGTGGKVVIPHELREYALQFKGKGIREVNNRAQPYLYPAFFIERDKFISNIKKLIDRAK